MAITVRKGLTAALVKTKLLPGELAVTTDTGELYFCYSAGSVKNVATEEDLQTMLDASGTAYTALQQLIADLELNPSELTNILANISALQTDKFDKANIAQTTDVNDASKVPSSAVSYSLAQSLDAINADLVVEDLSSVVTVSLTGLTVKLRRYGKHAYVLDFQYYGSASITNGILCATIPSSEYRPINTAIGAATGYNVTLIYSSPSVTVDVYGQIMLSGCTVASGTNAVVNGQIIWIR